MSPDHFWAYVAGFFDGEGTLSVCHTQYKMQVRIAQSVKNNGEEVFRRIQGFLAEHGIRSSVLRKRGNHMLRNELLELCIQSRPGIRHFLRKVLPYLIVKKVYAQDMLRWMTLFPPTGVRARSKVEVQKVKLLVAQGFTQREIAKQFGVSQTAIGRKSRGGVNPCRLLWMGTYDDKA